MQLYRNKDDLEVGVDEAGRGCLFGRVYAGAVIFPNNIELNPKMVKDSKKFTNREKRELAYDYVIKNCLSYGVGWVDSDEIDSIGILNATMKAMHDAIRNTQLKPDYILVDGTYFKPYMTTESEYISYSCVIGGDRTYYSIAGASIIAKVEHDRYIRGLCQKWPLLDHHYHLLKNMGYGTQVHTDGLNDHGATNRHRKSFNIVKQAKRALLSI
jgi:ribonuclease HII